MEGGAGAFFAKELSRISYRMHIEILDTTLRDGAQGCGVEFSPTDRMAVMHRLDELGIPYIKDEADKPEVDEGEDEPREHLQPKDRDEIPKQESTADENKQ